MNLTMNLYDLCSFNEIVLHLIKFHLGMKQKIYIPLVAEQYKIAKKYERTIYIYSKLTFCLWGVSFFKILTHTHQHIYIYII